jgi:predicted GIY-YIG superfamily endonuclease
VAKRLEQHNSGVNVSTKNRGPWTLEWQSGEMELGEARKAENALKRQKGGAGLEALLRRFNGG